MDPRSRGVLPKKDGGDFGVVSYCADLSKVGPGDLPSSLIIEKPFGDGVELIREDSPY